MATVTDRPADPGGPKRSVSAAPATRGRFGFRVEGTDARLPRPLVYALAFALLFALIYLLPLGVRPLASPDEVRYGAISHEMIASGDWVAPHLNGVRYFEKPPLGLWLESISMKLLGETAFALRLPVALATGLGALIVFALARRFTTPFAARLAAGIYLTTLIVMGLGTFVVLDAYLALFLTAALASFYSAIAAEEAGDARARRRYLVLCGAACGAAFLAKGFLALAIAVVVATPYLAARRRWKTLLASPWIPIAVAAVVVLPWAVLIQLREPDFWRYFFWVEHVRRFTADDAQHAQPFWYYFAWLPMVGWPWSLLLPAALVGLRSTAGGASGRASARAADDRRGTDGRGVADYRRSGDGRFIGYLAAWAVLPFLVLSLSKGKLLTYLLPCFAPLAILLAIGLERYLAGGKSTAVRAAALVIAALYAVLLTVLAAAQGGAFIRVPFAAEELPKLLGFTGLIATGIAFALYAAYGAHPRMRLAALAGTGAAVFLPLEVTVPGAVLDNVSPATVVARHVTARPDTILVSDAPLFGTVAWALERNDIYVLSPGEIGYGLSYPDARHRLLDEAALERLIAASAASAGHHGVLIVCESSTERRIEHVLPARAERSQHGKVIVFRIPPE